MVIPVLMYEDDFQLPPVICFSDKPQRRWIACMILSRVQQIHAYLVSKALRYLFFGNAMLASKLFCDLLRDYECHLQNAGNEE